MRSHDLGSVFFRPTSTAWPEMAQGCTNESLGTNTPQRQIANPRRFKLAPSSWRQFCARPSGTIFSQEPRRMNRRISNRALKSSAHRREAWRRHHACAHYPDRLGNLFGCLRRKLEPKRLDDPQKGGQFGIASRAKGLMRSTGSWPALQLTQPECLKKRSEPYQR